VRCGGTPPAQPPQPAQLSPQEVALRNMQHFHCEEKDMEMTDDTFLLMLSTREGVDFQTMYAPFALPSEELPPDAFEINWMEQSAYCGNNVWCFGPQSRQTDVLHKAAEQAATGCTVYCPVPEAGIKRNGDLLTQLAQQVDIAFVGDHFWDATAARAEQHFDDTAHLQKNVTHGIMRQYEKIVAHTSRPCQGGPG
jgi:hypothetical protein